MKPGNYSIKIHPALLDLSFARTAALAQFIIYRMCLVNLMIRNVKKPDIVMNHIIPVVVCS